MELCDIEKFLQTSSVNMNISEENNELENEKTTKKNKIQIKECVDWSTSCSIGLFDNSYLFNNFIYKL